MESEVTDGNSNNTNTGAIGSKSTTAKSSAKIAKQSNQSLHNRKPSNNKVDIPSKKANQRAISQNRIKENHVPRMFCSD